VLGIMHLTKDQERQAIYRIQGNIAFVAAARMVHAVVEDPDRSGELLFGGIKTNIATLASGLRFKHDDDGLEFLPEAITNNEFRALLSKSNKFTQADEVEQVDEAVEFLRDTLAEGQVRVSEIKLAAKAAAITWKRVERAKQKLRAQTARSGFGPGSYYVWRLP